MRRVLAGLALLGLIAPANAVTIMSGEGSPITLTATDEDYARSVKSAVDGYVIPGYEALIAATANMGEAIDAYCERTPDAAGREKLATQFTNMLAAWAGVDFLRFGPMARDGRYDRFAFWPDAHGTAARQLRRFLASEDPALLEPGAIAEQSAAVQGLPALEALLYQGDDALITAAAPSPFRCALAGAVAENLTTIVKEALSDWQGDEGWTALIENPGPSNPVYRSHSEAMTEILKAILTGLELNRDQRLLPWLGETAEEAKTSRAPYHRSVNTMAYLSAGTDALERFVEASGVLDLLPKEIASYGSSALFEFMNLKSALAAAGGDIEEAAVDPEKRGKLIYAAIVLQSIRNTFQNRIAPGAGLTPGFNSLDGD